MHCQRVQHNGVARCADELHTAIQIERTQIIFTDLAGPPIIFVVVFVGAVAMTSRLDRQWPLL